jgi:peptidoglycan/xylan/chitin deacetylase (PgdA/CDA1 family)
MVTAVSAPLRQASRPVPILEYHVIAKPPRDAPYPQLYVRPTDFAAQMRWLARHRYHAVTMDAVYASWSWGAKLPSRPVVLTFDDGYRSAMTEANRVLRRYRWPGNLNLLVAQTEHRGGIEPWRVRRLIADGWEVDAHTLTHPDLTTLSGAALAHEVGGSRRWVHEHLGVAADFFCYPAGRYDTAVIDAVKAAGFLGAESENAGFATRETLYALPRIRVSLDESLAAFAATLRRPA